ncbi:MAG: hypothetical protein HFG93_10945 [Dorea sp.]|nr:hypothetical protein [Dorea sp.]
MRAFALGDNASAKVTLEGSNSFKGAGSRAGLYVPQTATLNISSKEGASPPPTLNARGGYGSAGIGGDGYSGHCGTITIDAPGSTINATSGDCAAGIGGGIQGRSGKISIRNGTINAVGGNAADGNAAGTGIGSNLPPYNSEVVISGGVVTATGGTATQNGNPVQNYGIGCGSLSSEGNSVTLTTNSIAGNTNLFNGIVWGYGGNPNAARVYNDAILTESVRLNQTITIPTGSTLSVSPDSTNLSNAGRIEGGGILVNPDKLAPVEGSYLGIPMENRKVSLQVSDVVVKTSVQYTGADLLTTDSIITINKTRRVNNDIYEVDTKGWNRTIQKDTVETVTEIVDAAQYNVSYTKNNFGTFSLAPINVTQKELTEDMISIVGDYTYTGEEISPEIVVKYNDMTLTQTGDSGLGDYEIIEVKDSLAVGKGTVTIEATGRNYSGEASKTFDINAASLENATVQITPDTVEYNGQKQEPKITVTLSDSASKPLTLDKDYTVEYSSDNNSSVDFIKADSIKVTVSGEGNYTGTAPVQTYTINKKPLKIAKIIPESRKYDGTNEVVISKVEFEAGGLVKGDNANDVTLKSKGIIPGTDVGEYDTISFNEFELDGKKGGNYIITEPLVGDTITLGADNLITISQADAPDKPALGETHTVSETSPDKFTCTLEVKNPKEGAVYEYRMDSKDLPETEGWQDSPVFDNIEPESVHLFEARSKLDPNVKQSEIGEEEFTFDLLEETNKPADIKLTFSPNTDEQTFTGTISSDSKLDNVEYFIGKTGVEPKDEDYQSGDGAQLKTDCESNTEYTAYVRFKKTKTHKPSEPTTTTNSTNRLVAKPPIITPEDGTEFYESQEVTITHKLDGMTIYYTTDGTEPTLESPIYTEPFEITDTTTIKAFAVKNNMDDSEVATATLTLKLRDVKKPVIDPEGESEFTGSRLVEITCETEDATIYYTVDGSDPTTESKKYTEPFRVSTTTVVKAIGVKEGLNNSEIATATLNKSESAINVHAFLNPFITSGDGIENNIISDELMSKLDTTDKAAATESIYQTMTQELSVIGNHGDFTYLKMNFYDLVVKVKIDSDPLRDATLDDFAEGGYTITIPYPDGTSLEANDFAIAHMVASGEKTGNVETWYADKVTKTPYGLQFNITSASPLAIAWTAAVPGGPNSNNVSDGDNVVNPDGENPGGDDPNGDNPDGENPDGENPDGENPAGDDQNNGIVTSNPKTDADGAAAAGNGAGTGSVTDAVKSALSSLLPKTGDTNKIIAWVVVLAASIAVIVGLRIKSKKASGKPKKKH